MDQLETAHVAVLALQPLHYISVTDCIGNLQL